MTAKLKSTTVIIIPGATTKLNLSANGGIQSSLVKILIMSATTCKEPNHPTRLGPNLSCQKPSKRRSTVINSAAVMITTPKIRPIVKGEPIDKSIINNPPHRGR